MTRLQRNPFFTGRNELLETLHSQLGGNQMVALTQPRALYGLGGVGKTQIALEYVYQHALEYSAVFWIGAETDEQIVSSLLHIAEALQLPERVDKDQQRVVAAAQRWLSTHNQWLLVWDNMEDLALLGRFLPSTRSGMSLITTRSQTLGTHARGLDLLPMKQEEGMLFLLRRAKVLEPEATSEQMQQLAVSEPLLYATARELVTVLGGLPLALDQAGAYIEETRCSLKGYLQRYEQQPARLLDRRGGSGADHPQSVTATFTLSSERIDRVAADILRVCTFLHAEAIPEELFVEGVAHLGPELACLANNPTQFDQAIATLRSLSLLQRHPETQTLSMHRLVQEVLRESLEAMVAQQWSERAIQAVNATFPEPEHVNWARCERLVLHALMALQFVEAGRSVPEARELFLKTGSYLLERGRYTEAERFLAQAYTLAEFQYGENDLITIPILDRLATLYWRQEKYKQAEPLFQRALAISELHLGSSHPKTAPCLNNLALLYFEQGNYTQAEILQQRSLTIAECQLEPTDPSLAQNVDNMARIFEAQGKYILAEQLYQRALMIWESLPGPTHPNMTFTLNNLGILYLEQRKYEQAEPLLQHALAIRQQCLGPDHPRTATSLYNLARLFQEQGKYEEAVQMLQHALLIFEQRAGLDSSYLAKALRNLGILYQLQRKYEQAEPLFMRALAIQEQHLGQHHPATAQTLHDLALFRQMQGNLREAISCAERALKSHSQSLGDAHPKTVATRTLYAHLVQEQACAQEETPSEPYPKEIPDPRGKERHVSRSSHKAINPSSYENDPLQGFLDACCELHPRAWCRISDLRQAYERWAEDCQERFPLSRRAFAVQLKVHGYYTDRTRTARIWRGITLVKNEAVTKNDKK